MPGGVLESFRRTGAGNQTRKGFGAGYCCQNADACYFQGPQLSGKEGHDIQAYGQELTPQGRQFIVKAAEKMDEYMDDIFSAFTEEEQEELIRLLTKMKDQAAIQLENRRNRA